MLQEELDRIEWQGEQVYHMPAPNALASQAIIDKLTPLLPKDSKEVNLLVTQLHAMLDVATMMDPVPNPAIKGMSSCRLMTSPSSCSSRRDSGTHP
jgi:hypothetical protein